jgi:hypothetical protein
MTMARFIVTYTVHGTATTTIDAPDLASAKALVETEIDSDEFDTGLDQIDDVDYDIRELHPITRDGKEMWSTHVRPSDLPGHAGGEAAS